MKKIAVICVLRSGSEILLINRNKQPHTGKYSPVGGKLEPHESPRQAAVREVYEETGIRIKAPLLAGILTETSPSDYNWILYVYTAEVERVEPPVCNEGILEWVPIENLAQIPTPPTDMTLYEYVFKGQFFVIDALYDAENNMLEFVEEISGRSLLTVKKS